MRMIQGMLIRLLVWFGRDIRLEIETARAYIPPNHFIVPPPVHALVQDARELTSEFMASTHSGEWKRHQVLARLIREGASERDAALAIELALRGYQAK